MNLRPIGSNQNEVITNSISVLFSYKTPVAYIDNKTGQAFKTNQFWSRTTSKHINKWLDNQPARLIAQTVLDHLLDEVK